MSHLERRNAARQYKPDARASAWAGRNLSGTFQAGNDIGGSMSLDGMPTMGGIFSYGSISGIGGSFSGLNVGDLTAGGANTATTSGNLFAFDTGLAGMTAPSIPASITSDVLNALATAQVAMNRSVIDYFTAASQAQSDASTALTNAQNDATTAMGVALTNLTNSNNQLRTDANYEFNAAFTEWNSNPMAFAAETWTEAVGWRP